MSKYFLGIDTSCYTTSIAVVDENEKLMFDSRQVLKVKRGLRGLRQSEALFQHIKNLPILFEKLASQVDINKISKVSASNKPRNLPESYMPVFLAGTSFGKTIAAMLKTSYEEYSHQEGHIAAGKWSAEMLDIRDYIAVHISGGTTEILKVCEIDNKFKVQIIGATKDISAGQLIDRIGVMMGLNFPSGKELDKLSKNGVLGKIKLPVSTEGTYINFSGTETHVKRIIESRIYNNSDIAVALFECIYKSLFEVIKNSCKKTKINDVLLVGGVASNSFIRDNLFIRLKREGINVYLSKPHYSTDNAVGTALLGLNGGRYSE
ncbi:O-sialoglycoprotein endopeptidase [Caminicella sporogenes]|uniref:Kae1-like domain-containing protein n=1 Tax=Caminicella sporogenes TaxID=166485 RepID=UPI00253FBE27|nr:O-sialoglycoprotein endopeptidase [Caminicella sporogenes]WIF94540.1 O-sialoglycoprotein endopeptidase [Caminicella sporogenes]